MVGPHEYEVDMWNGELRSVGNPSKTIDIFKMDREGDAYSFWYDPKTMTMQRQAEKPLPPDLPPSNLHWVHFHPFKADPDFYKKIGEQTREAEQIIRNGDSYYNHLGDIRQSPIEGKAPRLLPMVNIYGTEFFLDIRLNEFRQVQDPSNAIPYSKLDIDEFHHVLLYDTRTKNAFNGSYHQACNTDGVKQIILRPLDLMIRDGIKRHEAKLRNTSTPKGEESGDDMPELTKRSRRRRMGM